jgi:hypothetical protein
VQLQQVMPATSPGAGGRSRLSEKYIVLPCCCILLLYKAGELRAQVFEFICLTWVELRGFEPLTSCMPFLAEPSGDVEVSLGLAGHCGYSVWLRPAASEAVRVRSHLISHWYCGPPPQDVRLLANRISSAFMSIKTSEASATAERSKPARWPLNQL